MRVTWLGWAGFEVESNGATVVVDPLVDPAAVFAPLGEAAQTTELPEVVPPAAEGRALAGLVSHLHRDHADAGALTYALDDSAVVFGPPHPGGGRGENLALAQARGEFGAAGLRYQEVDEWRQIHVGPFELTALPAVDGLGDPQVSWLIEADGKRVLHLGDTIFHGYWWRMSQRHGPFDVVLAPINGAVVRFPHLQPPSPLGAALDPEQAAIAGELLGARIVVPMHYGGLNVDPWYNPVADAARRFADASAARSYEARALRPGQNLEL